MHVLIDSENAGPSARMSQPAVHLLPPFDSHEETPSIIALERQFPWKQIGIAFTEQQIDTAASEAAWTLSRSRDFDLLPLPSAESLKEFWSMEELSS